MQNASSQEVMAVWGILGVAILGLLYAVYLTRQILGEDQGTEKMQQISRSIREGAVAYLNRQLRTIVVFIAILTVALFGSAALITNLPKYVTDAGFDGMAIALGRAGAFLMGSLFSLLVGQIGMRMAVLGNVRVAAAARTSFGDALRIGYRTGTITGMLTDGLGLLGGTAIFMAYGQAAPEVLLGFGFGGTLIALFMRVGGGIYTKAADVGADLVGKVEKDLPEDDPRNAAVIADLVGDNVGDCAGMAADIFESYEVTIVSAMILGISLATAGPTFEFKWILFPLMVRAIGVIASIISTYSVKASSEQESAFKAIDRGFRLAAMISTVGFVALALVYVQDWRVAAATATGIVLAVITNILTEYFTEAMQILKNAGITIGGLTMCWDYPTEKNHVLGEAALRAAEKVYGLKYVMVFNDGGDRPGVIYRRDDGAMAVSIRPSVRDVYDHTFGKKTEADIQHDADGYITADGSRGKFVDRIKAGKCLIFYTHAQTLYGNGTKSGFKVFQIAIDRLQKYYGDRIQWMTGLEICRHYCPPDK